MIKREFVVRPIGEVGQSRGKGIKEVIVYDEFAPGLAGVEDHLFLTIVWWLHHSEIDRDTLQFKPILAKTMPRGRGRSLKLHGVFSSRAPLRPNPIAITVVQLIDLEGSTLLVRGLDALPGSPVLDIKPHFLF
ncbi:TrmO family methyltransferase domain-containing protein [Ammonifex thiophilus]|uniref:S-adenosylmethionine-dependent methyltransferase n=1 Tax=Ammonifex thiophilus TaxID=444093 RepID=A0A3D8P2X5_9THEO|nr:TrmO family methyltransferase [Ammonifex thiophilus]RDV80954.1 S-adenosylmethionine-dependent methyltransferase [Ammonifex thiophilus]